MNTSRFGKSGKKVMAEPFKYQDIKNFVTDPAHRGYKNRNVEVLSGELERFFNIGLIRPYSDLLTDTKIVLDTEYQIWRCGKCKRNVAKSE